MPSAENKAVSLLIFDLDGTLADTIGSIKAAINVAMVKHGLPEKSYGDVRAAIGNGAVKLIRRLLPSERACDGEYVATVLADYEAAYDKLYSTCRECYGGMSETIDELKSRGYEIAVLSNKQDVYVKGLVKILFPKGEIKLAMGQTELPKKPDPTVPLMIAERFGISAGATAFIGDSDVDIFTAKNAGMTSVGCSWGYRDRELLIAAGADRIVDKPTDLLEIFK